MSQDLSTNTMKEEQLIALSPIKPWSAKSEADKLMDDLFLDIDRILEGGSKLPTEPVQPEYVSLKSIKIPKLTMPPVMVPQPELAKPGEKQQIDNNTQSIKPSDKSDNRTSSSRKTPSGWSWDKIILGVGFFAVAVTMILLLTNRNRLTWSWFGQGASLQNPQLSASDAQFISYMLRSLEVIDSSKGVNQKQTTATTDNSPERLLPTTENQASFPEQAPSVLERVYYPVYPTQRLPAPKESAPKPSAPEVKPSVPEVKPSVVAPPPAASLPVLTSPSASPTPVTVTESESEETSSSSSPVAKHTLVGLVELGLGADSAALFEIDGITQRVYIGEGIGSSGWTLVSVANDEAVIRRNGEVRSVYPGQKF